MSLDVARDADISVVMATYNGEAHLAEQLRSILAQTLLPIEIVITDDRSTDGTADVVGRIAQDSPVPIRFSINAQRLGYAGNFLKAASLSTGRYVSFSDQDDIWHPEKLERSRRALCQPGVHLVGHQMNLVDEMGRFLRLDTHGIRRTTRFTPGRADPFGVFFGFTMTFDRRLLSLLPAEERGADSFRPSMPLAHDRWIYFLATTFGSAELLATPLADYRQHASQSFGVRRLPFATRLQARMVDGAARVAALDRIASARAAQIDGARPSEAGDGLVTAAAWSAGGTRWRRLARYCRRRVRTYSHGAMPIRLVLLLTNMLSGAYRGHGAGGLGTRHLLEDLALGVVLPGTRARRAAPGGQDGQRVDRMT